MTYEKMKYSDTKMRRQNVNEARTYFNYDLTKEANLLHDEMFQMGMRWFNKGRSLDIAPRTLLDDIKFMCGYKYAKKEMYNHIFQLGYKHFTDGGSLESIPVEYQNNNIFRAGFEKARKDSLKESQSKNSSRR